MKYITHRHMIGLTDELQKNAGIFSNIYRGVRAAHRGAGNFSRSGLGQTMRAAAGELKGGYGKQMMLGAGVGAGGGAVLGDPDQPGGRVRGALMGAGIGAGVVGGGILATKGGRDVARKGVGDFYHRQRYALTGKGLGKTRERRLRRARDIGLVEKVDRKLKGTKGYGAMEARIREQEAALHKGYLSAPGVVHGVLTRPGDVLKSGWRRGGKMGKAFAGLGAYESGKGFIEKPKEGGPGRLEKGLRGAGGALGWTIAPASLLGGQIIGMGGGSIGGTVGKLGDKVVGKVRRSGRARLQGG